MKEGAVVSSTLGDEDSGDNSVGAVNTYEAVLQSLATSNNAQPTFLITQPQNSPAVSFSAGNLGSDHIIVHTLPIAQVSSCLVVSMIYVNIRHVCATCNLQLVPQLFERLAFFHVNKSCKIE